MIIREYNEKDWYKVVEIYAKVKMDELRFEKKQFEFLPLEKDKKRLNELKESDIYICQDSEIVGYGALHDNEIRAVYVIPSERGKGIGKCLFEFLLSKVNGSPVLYVAKTNFPAKKLYKQYGFVVTNEFETIYNGKSVFAHEMEQVFKPKQVANKSL